MPAVTRAVIIRASQRAVWDVTVDVERWPAWATYMKRLRRQDSGPFELGSRVKVTPKGMPGTIWAVTEYDPPRSFTWVTRLAPGLGLIGGHIIEAHGDESRATFSLQTNGPLGAALSPLLGILFRRNTRLATEGLKRYCEAQRR